MKKLISLLVFVMLIQIAYATHIVTTQHTGNSLLIIDGTNISGTLEDTFIDDENKFIIQEAIVTGTDIFLVQIDFTGLPATDNLQELRLLINASAIFNEPDDFVEFAMYDFFCEEDFYLFSEILNGTDVFLNLTIDTLPNCYYNAGLVRTAFGDIDNVVTPIKDNMSLDYFILEVVDLQNDYNIELISPIDNLITTDNIITFNFEIDNNGSCNLTANNVVRNVSNFTGGANYFIENMTVGVYDWKIGCEDETSELWRLIITVVEEPFFQTCEMTLTNILLMSFFLFMSFGFIGLTVYTRIKGLWSIAGILFIITGIAIAFLMTCLSPINYILSIVFVGLGIFFMTLMFSKF